MGNRREIMFAGSGGQGVITASVIFGEAAALHEGYHVVQSQAYGPEARGGASSAHVIVNDIRVGFPKVLNPQVLVCLTQEALDRFAGNLRPGGLLLTDRYHVKRLKPFDARIYNLSMSTTVLEKVGLPITLNICMLGAVSGLIDLVKPESLKEVISARVPERFLEKNLLAFELGRELALDARPWRAEASKQAPWTGRAEPLPDQPARRKRATVKGG